MKRLLVVLALALAACNADLTTVLNPYLAQTLVLTDVTGTAATLVGTVNPGGLATQGWFEWSTDPLLTEPAATSAQEMGSGNTDVRLTATMTGLVPDDTYYYRAVASNAGGVKRGYSLHFTTPRPPTVYTLHVGGGYWENSVSGFVMPNGHATFAWIEYGTDSTFTTVARTPKEPIGSGLDKVDISLELPLLKSTKYFARLMGSNVGGTTAGNVTWFTTGSPPSVLGGYYAWYSSCEVMLYAFGWANHAITKGWFEYSASASMSNYTVTAAQTVRDGSGPTMLTTRLPADGTFYFTAVVSNWLATERTSVKMVSVPPSCGSRYRGGQD